MSNQLCSTMHVVRTGMPMRYCEIAEFLRPFGDFFYTIQWYRVFPSVCFLFTTR
jgi:hypothetical protein